MMPSSLRNRAVLVGSITFALTVMVSLGVRQLGQSRLGSLLPLGNSPVEAQTTDTETLPINAAPQKLDERLKQSIRLADKSRYTDAIAQLDAIPETDPAANQAQLLRQTWSLQMLDRALEKYKQADLRSAIVIAAAIPQDTEAGREAGRQLPTWQRQKLIIDNALALLKSNPQQALDRLKVFENAPFAQSSRFKKWQSQAQAQIRWRRRYYY